MTYLSQNVLFFFFNDTATTEIYTLSLHDALPIYDDGGVVPAPCRRVVAEAPHAPGFGDRSEEHTSELQSQSNLVCRLLLEKKKTLITYHLEQRRQQQSPRPDRRRPHQSQL